MCEEWSTTPQHPTDKDRNWYDAAAARDTRERNFIKWFAFSIPDWFPVNSDLSSRAKQTALQMHTVSYLLHQVAEGPHTTAQLENYVDRCGQALQDSTHWYALLSELAVLYSLPAAEPAQLHVGAEVVDMPQAALLLPDELRLAS